MAADRRRKDHIAPSSATETNLKLYRTSKAVTDYKEHPERSQLQAERGRLELSGYAVDWVIETLQDLSWPR
jgi:transposase